MVQWYVDAYARECVRVGWMLRIIEFNYAGDERHIFGNFLTVMQTLNMVSGFFHSSMSHHHTPKRQ